MVNSTKEVVANVGVLPYMLSKVKLQDEDALNVFSLDLMNSYIN